MRKTYSAKDGLPQSIPTQILQSRDGHLWATSFGGLTRFDGVHFTNFNLANTEAFASDRMTALYEDAQGTLWIGHESGGVTRYENGVFLAYSPASTLPTVAITSIARDVAGTLWLSLAGGQLASCSSSGCVIQATSTTTGTANMLLADRNGQLWLGAEHGLFQRHAGQWAEIRGESGVSPGGIYRLSESIDGSLILIGNEGVTRFDGEQFQRLFSLEAGKSIRVALRDGAGDVWIGTIDSLLHAARKTGKDGTVTYGSPEKIHPEFFDSPIYAIFEDREGSIWVGASGRGLTQLTPQVLRRYTVESGLIRHEVMSITGDGQAGLWVGSGCASPLLKMKGNSFVPVDMPAELASPCLYGLHHAPDGMLWAGFTSHLGRFDGVNWTLFPLPEGTHAGSIRSVARDRSGHIWLGTENSGAYRFDDGAFTQFSSAAGLPDDDVRFIMQDRHGAMWFGTERGLTRLDDGRLVSYTPADGLSRGTVRAIHEDADGTLWIGTYGGGLSRYKDGKFVRITQKNGLFDNVISRILEDEKDRFWMLGNRGLFFVTRTQLNAFANGELGFVDSVSFTESDGMVEGSGGTQPAGWRTADGDMWFPTMDGVAHVRLDTFRLNTIPPPVTIDQVLVEGIRQPVSGPLNIAAGQRNLEIRYTGLSFLQQDKMRFRYRLRGFEETWNNVGNRREAYYSDIPPGEYVFEVTAANSHGVWNSSGSQLVISKAPFFYQTGYFYVMAMGLLVLLTYGTFALRARRIHERNALLSDINKELNQQVTERQRAEAALAEKNKELQKTNLSLAARHAEMERFTYTVSHDLKSPLVTIKGFLRLLQRDLDSGNKAQLDDDLNRITRATDTMGRLLDELLELSRIGQIASTPEPVALTQLAHEAADLLDGQIIAGKARVLIAPDMPVAYGDRARLLQVFQNLIDNAVKFSRNCPAPTVEIGGFKNSDEVVCFVKDNGIGIRLQHQKLIFRLFERAEAGGKGTGIGLALVERIIEVHGGRVWVESDGPGQGATFYFTLPPPP